MGEVRPARVDVDLSAIRDNVAALVQTATPARLCAVVKADGYGHGDVPVAEAALAAGAEWLAVALVEEGVRIREAGIDAPMLLLAEPPPADAAEVVRWDLIPTVYQSEFMEAVERAAPAGYPIHIKIDTGMHRVGAPRKVALELARRAVSSDLALEGLWTHFAVADADEEFTRGQLEQFIDFVETLAAEGIRAPLAHAANTAGTLAYPEARLDMVRVGLGIYGLRPAPGLGSDTPLRPAMRVSSSVLYVQRLPAGSRPSYGRRRPLGRESTVATVPVGYADGLVRRLPQTGGEVLIRGRRYPFAGTVTMDQVVIDLGDDPVDIGDEVVLLGRQGGEEVTAEEWADRLDTINYEIVCGFGPRMPRQHLR
ncbi:MAG: alanine racemase [Acidimicrobiia bacterium]